jgi:HEAT repeat protein
MFSFVKLITSCLLIGFLVHGTHALANSEAVLDYDRLREKITFGKATFAEVREALTEPNVVNLTNTLHALYSMRWHRAVLHLYQNIWDRKREQYPELAWELLEKIPPRIALASTINRVRIFNTEEYKAFIRSHRYDDHEFIRAQVVVSLGLNGDPDDIEYLVKMVHSTNHYVVQTAITSLALLGHVRGKEAMIILEKTYRDEPRGKLLRELLKLAYRWEP